MPLNALANTAMMRKASDIKKQMSGRRGAMDPDNLNDFELGQNFDGLAPKSRLGLRSRGGVDASEPMPLLEQYSAS